MQIQGAGAVGGQIDGAAVGGDARAGQSDGIGGQERRIAIVEREADRPEIVRRADGIGARAGHQAAGDGQGSLIAIECDVVRRLGGSDGKIAAPGDDRDIAAGRAESADRDRPPGVDRNVPARGKISGLDRASERLQTNVAGRTLGLNGRVKREQSQVGLHFDLGAIGHGAVDMAVFDHRPIGLGVEMMRELRDRPVCDQHVARPARVGVARGRDQSGGGQGAAGGHAVAANDDIVGRGNRTERDGSGLCGDRDVAPRDNRAGAAGNRREQAYTGGDRVKGHVPGRANIAEKLNRGAGNRLSCGQEPDVRIGSAAGPGDD